MTSAEIRPSRRTNDAVCFFSYEYLSETAKSNCAVKRMEESARWADLTIRLVVEANCMSARKLYINIQQYSVNNTVELSCRGAGDKIMYAP